jgi:hypothetical protein
MSFNFNDLINTTINMSTEEKPEVESVPTEEAPLKRKKDKYRREKPWDNDPTLDKWKVEAFAED